jgi:hypothetical protein
LVHAAKDLAVNAIFIPDSTDFKSIKNLIFLQIGAGSFLVESASRREEYHFGDQ